MENSSLEESKPPSAVIAVDLGAMESRADAASTRLPTKDLPLQCLTSSSSNNLHSNNATVKTEEMPEILETQNVLENVMPSRRKPRKTQRVINVEEGQTFTDDGDLVEYASLPTDRRHGAAINTSIATSSSQSVNLDSFVRTETNVTAGGSAVQCDSVETLAQPRVNGTPAGKDVVPLKRIKRDPGCLDSVIHCTACNCQIGFTTSFEMCAHPALKVLICKKCYKWYTSDEIEKGADGMDEQCRWCSEGGDLICCDFCHNAFCKSCIRRNLGRKALMDIIKADDGSKWHCYICDSKPILHLMEQCTSILESMTNCPKVPRPKVTHQRKKGAQLKNAGFDLEALVRESLFKTSDGLTNNLPPFMANIWQGNPPSFSYDAKNRGYFSADAVENALRMVSLPSYPATSFAPTFPGVGQLREGVLGSTSTTGRGWNYPTMDNPMETWFKLDYLLSASVSMLNVLTSLQNDLRLVGGRSADFMPLLADGRRMIAARLWSAQRSYLQTFENAVHMETSVDEAVSEMFQNGGVDWSVGTGMQNVARTGTQKVARRNRRKGIEIIDLTCGNNEMLKTPLSTVPSNPLFSKYDGGASAVPFDVRLTNALGLYKSDCMLLSEATNTPLANMPSRRGRKRKYPMTAS